MCRRESGFPQKVQPMLTPSTEDHSHLPGRLRQDRYLRETLTVPLGLALAALLLHLLGIGCPIRRLTGIPCAGCGMSRALLLLLQGRLREAAAYHPLVFLAPAALAVWCFRRRIPPRMMKALLAAAIAAFITVYVIRLFLKDPVLRPDLSEGLILQVITEVKNVLFTLW